MMTKRNYIITGLIGILMLSVLSMPQSVNAAGQAAAYLREGIGARALGMGNAGTTCNEDATAAYWNPAALPSLEALGVASQTGFLEWERSWNFLNVVYPGTRLDGAHYALGVGWIHFSAGNDIEARTYNRPEADYTFEDSQNTFLFSAAAETPSGINLGANFKILNHSLDGVSGSGIGLDIAAFQIIHETWQWGMMLQDVYSSINWPGDYQDRVPMMIRAGVSYQGVSYNHLEKRLVVAAELGSSFFHAAGTFQEFQYKLGVEYKIFSWLAIREGLDSGRLTQGIGFGFRLQELAIVHIDYALALETSAGMGFTHLLSLAINCLPK